MAIDAILKKQIELFDELGNCIWTVRNFDQICAFAEAWLDVAFMQQVAVLISEGM